MKLYDVQTNLNVPIVPSSHMVVAYNKKQAIQMVVDHLNTTQTVILYQSSYFCAHEVIADNFSEPIILI